MNDVFAWVAVSLLCGATMLAMALILWSEVIRIYREHRRRRASSQDT